jgi:hypothetical protein
MSDGKKLHGVERRRTIRLRRTALLSKGLDGLEKPSIKIADIHYEYMDTFRILYDSYLELKYIQDNYSRLYCSLHHFIPGTCIFIFKSWHNIICTLTRFKDSELFGLPMDCLYKDELDELRSQGRVIAEIGALASPKDQRWSNSIYFLKRTVILQSILFDVDDLCIMVNPKHVQYYKDIYLFSELGSEKSYESFDAPAVALRLDLIKFKDKIKDTYQDSDYETNLYDFFYEREKEREELEYSKSPDEVLYSIIPKNIALEIVNTQPQLFSDISAAQKNFLQDFYGEDLFSI